LPAPSWSDRPRPGAERDHQVLLIKGGELGSQALDKEIREEREKENARLSG
jgi:hypothetical protein